MRREDSIVCSVCGGEVLTPCRASPYTGASSEGALQCRTCGAVSDEALEQPEVERDLDSLAELQVMRRALDV